MRYLDLANPIGAGKYPSYTEDELRTCPTEDCEGETMRLVVKKMMEHKGKTIYEWTERYIACRGKCKRIYTGLTNIKVTVIKGPTEVPWEKDEDDTRPEPEKTANGEPAPEPGAQGQGN